LFDEVLNGFVDDTIAEAMGEGHEDSSSDSDSDADREREAA
jgi:hypothetical protein